MKKVLAVISLTISIFSFAQTKLVGLGTYLDGSVFAMNDDGSEAENWVNFSYAKQPSSNKPLEVNGRLWAVTTDGTTDHGSIISINKDGSDYQRVFTFSQSDGSNPKGTLTHIDGKLWGVAERGGEFDHGTIFTIDIDGTNFQKVHDFNSTVNGENPTGQFLVHDNQLWGVTGRGGTAGWGTIYSIELDGSNFTSRYQFPEITTGRNPSAGLTLINGKLWGATLAGGATDDGTIYNINPDGSQFTIVHEFNNEDGDTPITKLIESNGKIWGSTSQGGTLNYGTIFNIDTDGTNFNVVHMFNNTEGRSPIGDLLISEDKLYGVARSGAENSGGGIFSIDSNGENYTLIRAFESSTSATWGLSIIDDEFYGLTQSGGVGNNGTIYKFNPQTEVLDILYDFNNENGASPRGTMIRFNGKLWGVASRGGANGDGTIFYINEDGTGLTKVHDFVEENGRLPLSNLALINDQLYGLTYSGGQNGGGVIFRFDPADLSFVKLYDFENATGRNPTGGALTLSNGKLWGMNEFGGSQGEGTIFNINLDGTGYTVVLDFDGTNGERGYSSFLEYNGLLWAMTNRGGENGNGVIFTINPIDGTYNKIRDMDTNDFGGFPRGSFIEYNEKLLATTFSGGPIGNGTIFSLDPSTLEVSIIHNFDGTNGSIPHGDLTENNGKFYGMTYLGGAENVGTVFSINPNGTGFTVLQELNSELGGRPNTGSNLLIFIDDRAPIITSPDAISIAENTIGTIYTASADESATFTLGTSKDESNFTNIDGLISFTAAPDFENPQDGDGNNTYLIDLIATDAAGNASTLEVIITVTDLDEIAPTITSGNSANIPENTAGTIYTATADESATFTLGTSKDESNFTNINGVISFTTAPDFEDPQDGDGNNTYLIDLIATDAAGNASTLEVTITVTDLDEIAPMITSGNAASISENTAGTIYTATADESATFTLGTGKDESNFTNINGVISFTTAPDFESPEDGDGNNTYLIDLIATDAAGNASTLEVTITVTDLDEIAPTITSGNSASIPENTAGTIYTASADESATFTLGTSKDESNFTNIDGLISFTAAPDFENPQDGDGNNTYLIDLIATDAAGNASTLEVIITVTDLDEIAPTITSGNSANIPENTAGTIYTATADESATFTLGTSKDESNFTNINGVISFTTAPDFEDPQDGDGNNTYLIDLIATDAAGNASTLEVTITVTDLDEIAPMITSGNAASISENTAGTIYTATADESATFTLGTSKDENNFTNIDGVISFTTAPDFESPEDGDGNNTYLIDIIATDAAGNASTLEVTITVTDLDEIAPTITSGNSASIPENTAGTIYTASADESATFTLGTSKDESNFTNIDGLISFTAAPDFEDPQDGDGNNTYLIDIIATDDEGNTSTLEVTITVTDLDEDAPIITSTDAVSIPENTVGTIYTATADENVTFTLGTSKDESNFTNIDGVISFTTAPDFEDPQDGDGNNTYLIDIIATDDEGNTSTLEVTITVTDLDEDAPIITSTDAVSITENSMGIIYTATANESVTFTLGTSKDEGSFNIEEGNISFISVPDFENPQDNDANNTYLIDVIASDGEGNSSTLEVTITITDLDEIAPTITSESQISIAENTTGTIYTATADESVTFALGTSKDEGNFNNEDGNISFISVPDFENPQDLDSDNAYLIDLIATDPSGNESSIELVITITDEEDDVLSITNPTNIKVYPNPATDALTIQGDNIVESYLVSLEGKTVRKFGNEVQLNIQGIVPGIYQLIIVRPDDRQTIKVNIR